MSGITLSASVRQNLLSLQWIPPTCSRPRRAVSPPARRSTARSTIRPTSSPPPVSMPAPATSAICSIASATACRCCSRPPTPASPRCRSLVDTAKSIANQVLQQPSGYTSKATFTSAAPTGAGPLAGLRHRATDLTVGGTNSLVARQSNSIRQRAPPRSRFGEVPANNRINSITGLNSALSAAKYPADRKHQQQRFADFHLDQRCRLPGHHQRGCLCRSRPPRASTSANIDSTSGAAFTGGTIVAATADPAAQATRASLVAQYNKILPQITTTAQDSRSTASTC